jgi:hypothetical protein
MDLRIAYTEIGHPDRDGLFLRVGRQEIFYGEQRMLGSANWGNTARTFDAARLTLRRGALSVEAFAASVVEIRPGALNKHAPGNNLHGLVGRHEKLIPQATIETYVFWRLQPRVAREIGGRANLDLWSFGTRLVGRIPSRSLDYTAEMYLQTGSLGPDPVSAWAGFWEAGYTFRDVKFKPRPFADYNFATGDKDPRDNRRQTFELLYPTPHDKYGLGDQVGWRNIHHVRTGVDIGFRKNLTVRPNVSAWWLANARDGLYNAGGALLARLPDGSGGRRVGSELDVLVTYAVNKQLQISMGAAHLFPGPFLRIATPGRSYNYAYTMATYSF